MDIEKNFQQIKRELTLTGRAGIEDFLAWLEFETDFKSAPASTIHHLNVLGGLAQHSLNTLRFARVINKEFGNRESEINITIAALLHDLCKVNYYIQGEAWDKEWKDKTNQWRKIAVWKIDDKLPLGHGEKSVILARKFIDLADSEMLAIRWHMVKWDVSDPGIKPMNEARDKYPLVKIIAMADQMAETYETLGEEAVDEPAQIQIQN
jgi:HD superfamily phosphohydrolase YqeK